MNLVKEIYEVASWRLALDLRAGKTFPAAPKEIASDRDWWSIFQDEYKDDLANGTKRKFGQTFTGKSGGKDSWGKSS